MTLWLLKKKKEFEEQERKYKREIEERLDTIKREEDRQYYDLHKLVTEIFQDTGILVKYTNETKEIEAGDIVKFRVTEMKKQMKLLKESNIIFATDNESSGWTQFNETLLAIYLLKHVKIKV